MKFSVDKRELYVIFKLNEPKLNTVKAPELKSELVVLNAEGFRNIILDLRDVDFVDSSGLSALLVANRLCKEHNGLFVITNYNDNIKRLVRISQLEGILTLIPTVQEAEDYIKLCELEKQITAD